ncbi:MAG: bifunctional DNA primase/polymerase [Candidatus Bathyarchaeia archaeon]
MDESLVTSMFQIKPARTLHEIYEQDFVPQRETGIYDWREWLVGHQWRKQLEFYSERGWSMRPIAARGKRPVQNRNNYSTVNKKAPPLTVKQALDEWIAEDFNLAIMAGPSKIIWLDIDEPERVPASFLDGASDYLMMRTARGLAVPVERSVKIRELNTLTRRLSDIFVDTVRRGNSYQLVPLSVTCTRDNGTPDHRVDFGNAPCIDAPKHDLRVREWLDLSKPVMTQETLRRLTK